MSWGSKVCNQHKPKTYGSKIILFQTPKVLNKVFKKTIFLTVLKNLVSKEKTLQNHFLTRLKNGLFQLLFTLMLETMTWGIMKLIWGVHQENLKLKNSSEEFMERKFWSE